MGAPRAEQDPLDRRVDAIHTDKRIDEDRLPVLEVGLDWVAVIDEPHQPVPNVNAPERGNGRGRPPTRCMTPTVPRLCESPVA